MEHGIGMILLMFEHGRTVVQRGTGGSHVP